MCPAARLAHRRTSCWGHAGTLAASARQPVTRVNSAALKHGRLACLGAR
jgi:hypothetical protein